MPRRTCVGCRAVKAKPELIRLVALAGVALVDARGRAAGRGAYLCPDSACWSTAERRRALERAIGVRNTPDDWQRLREGILV